MRSLKKITAVVIALAMVLGLMSFNVFAADGITIDVEAASTVGQGKTVDVNIYYTAADDTTFSSNGFELHFTAPAGVTVTDNAPANALYTVEAGSMTIDDGVVLMGSLSGSVKAGKNLVASVKFTVGSDVAEDSTITFTTDGVSILDGGYSDLDTTVGALPTITVVAADEITAVEPVTLDTLPMLTAKEDVIAALPASVNITASAGNKVVGQTVAVSAWECADYDDKTTAAQTFVGTLAPVDPITAASGLTATATVTLTKITDPTVEAAFTTYDLVIAKDGDGNAVAQDEAAVAAAVAAALENKVTLKKGEISEVVTLDASAFVADAAVTNVGDTATVTITVPTDVTAEKFAPAAALTATVEVTVIPDVITDITWGLTQLILTPSRELAVQLTYAGADYANAPVTVIAKLNGADEQTLTDLAWVLANDGDDAVADVATINLGTVKDVYAAAKSGDVLTLTVTVNGSPVQVDVDDLGEAIVEADFAITADGVSGGISGVPVGGGAPSTPSKPVLPGTDEPGTDEPGTDEPGTDEPGTDVPGTPVEGPFEDVPADHWAVEFIKEMKDMGIVSGKSATIFDPNGGITRAEFVKMIVIAFGLEIGSTESDFVDCGADDWYTPYVVAAANAGYVNGISSTEFGANNAITRQDICTILGRILGLTAGDAEIAFTDADDIADYALDYVKALAAAGVINGYSDGSFAPTKTATRAEVCKILSTLFATITEDAPEEEAAEEEVVEEVVEEEVEEA